MIAALWPAWAAAHQPLLAAAWALLEVGGGAAAGYVVIGAIAFTLGVCVTVLCFKLRAGAGRDAEDRDDRDNR